MQIIENLPFAQYQRIMAMNPSTLVHGRKSMRALKAAIDGGSSEPTQAMRFGNKYHTLILEPEEFEESFCVMPNFAAMQENVTSKGDRSDSWATSFAKESKKAFERQAELDGKQVITREEYDRGLAMCEAVANDPYASELIATSKREVTLLGEIEGVEFKGRLDLCGDKIADLKGTATVEAIAFGRSAANLKYGFKMSIYRELYRQNFNRDPEDVCIIAVETGGCFDCCVYDEMDAALDEGYDRVIETVRAYKTCIQSGRWPGVNRGQRSVPLYVPNWAMPEDDLEVAYVAED
jgi:hypothetical protein